MSDSNLRSWRAVSVILAIVFLGFVGSGIWVAMVQRRVSDDLTAVSKRQQKISEHIKQQAAALNRAIGRVLPVIRPPDWESRLAALETQSHDLAAMTKSQQEISNRVEQQTAVLNQSLDRILPATTPADWENRLAALEAQSHDLAAMTKSQQATSKRIEQQTAVLNQVLGAIPLVPMPPDWEGRLAAVEAQVTDTNRWPKDAAEARHFLEQTSGLVKDVPAWAETRYLSRLNAVRWAAMAFAALEPDSGTAQQQIVDQLNALANARPEAGSADLEQELKKTADSRATEIKKTRLTEAIQQADQYLAAKMNDKEASTGAGPDILSVYEFLGLHAKNADRGSEIRYLRKRLRERMIERQAEEQASALRTRWQKVRGLKNKQPRVYETAANMLLGEVTTARVALAIDGVEKSDYDGLESEIRRELTEIAARTARRQEERQAKAIREYQRWALGQIKSAERRLADASAQADKNARVLKADNGGWSDERYKEVRDAMVKYLLPINLALLDLPVQQRYQRPFQDGWKRLDGREDQTYVAEQTVKTVKKSLRDFLEDMP